ncbi:hypothetical protein TSAR_002791 [Trichomalopsis sarcophagae]|uniref:Uncharacterized protein n=1 Tax=Trichomalopsis sarcophagae TaxID=543379 RepID=A0A232F4M1_9HYME|nr:hypothetical protein TSAR_002791 [Trichomalopsis sarcophagae]
MLCQGTDLARSKHLRISCSRQ